MRVKYGQDVAFGFSKEIWLNRGARQSEIAMFGEAMDIYGDNLAAHLKALQIAVGFLVMDAAYGMEDKTMARSPSRTAVS